MNKTGFLRASTDRVLHCWEDRREWIEKEHGSLSPEMLADIGRPSATCLLPDGHKGPHEWTPDEDISVKFEA